MFFDALQKVHFAIRKFHRDFRSGRLFRFFRNSVNRALEVAETFSFSDMMSTAKDRGKNPNASHQSETTQIRVQPLRKINNAVRNARSMPNPPARVQSPNFLLMKS